MKENRLMPIEPNTQYYCTEKIDGTNGRIILYKGDYLIGSRESILYGKGDRFGDPVLGIVDVLKPIADKLVDTGRFDSADITVIYQEVYGGKVTKASKQYTSSGKTGSRVLLTL